MPVLLKINQLRQHIHSTELKKTGRNTFSNYNYFELADFLVPALEKCFDLNLSAVVSFTADLALMTVTDLDDNSQFVLTSPMSSASLKACHEVQNLGAVQTYLRRYLWVALLEIVEHDAIDSSAGPEDKRKGKGSISATGGAMSELTADKQKFVAKIAAAIAVNFGKGDDFAALEEMQHALEAVAKKGGDEQMFKAALFNALSPQQRAALTNLEKEAA